MATKFSFHITGLTGALDTLKALPPAIVSNNGGPVRKALRVAAIVLRDEAKKNVQAIMDDPTINPDDDRVPTGRLRDSIVVQRSRPNRGTNGERYLVRIRQSKYPAEPGEPTTRQVGRLLEYGAQNNNMPPRFWLRRAFDSHKMLAVQVFVSQFWKEIALVKKKLGISP